MASKSTNIVTQIESPESSAILAIISKAASDPNTDVEKMERLLAMAERVSERNAEAAFAAAMTKVQADLPTVATAATNQQTSSKYAKHEAIAKAIKPIYTAEGFSITFSQDDCPKEDHLRIAGILRHSAGHKEHHHLDLPLDVAGIKGNVNKTPTHATGSTYSYGRRYLTCMMFDVATGDDDDGNAAGVPTITESQLADINSLIEEVTADKGKFLEYLKIDDLTQIPAKSYQMCIAALEAKRKR